jgi:hypothetical protein
MKLFRLRFGLCFFILLWLENEPVWAVGPVKIYQELNSLFVAENVSEVLKIWGNPMFEEHGIPYWQWEGGVLCCIVEKGQAKVASYAETADSIDMMDSKLLAKYRRLKKSFKSIFKMEGVEMEANWDVGNQPIKSITTMWKKGNLQFGWICSYNGQFQNTTLQFIVRRQ